MKNLFTFTLALSSLIFIDAEAQVASPQMGSATGVTQQAPTEKQPTKAQPVSKKKKKAKKASPVSDLLAIPNPRPVLWYSQINLPIICLILRLIITRMPR
jgi:hypothetical protein